MKGWKTWVGGIGGIATGIAMIAAGAADNFNMDLIVKGALTVFASLGAIGIGHKIEKAGNGGS